MIDGASEPSNSMSPDSETRAHPPRVISHAPVSNPYVDTSEQRLWRGDRIDLLRVLDALHAHHAGLPECELPRLQQELVDER